jgi:2-oxoglutarate ferredoxin oxidoreductase subunit alpha
LGFPIEEFNAAIAAKFAKKSQKVVDSNIAAFAEGIALVEESNIAKMETLPQPESKGQLFLLGNEAIALGAVAAGSRFMASYPITPASEVMEYMLKEMHEIGATVIQTEDEIAACMAAMGGAYAGVRGFTCTSGPGISLMAESLSMASIAEIPVVVIDVMRSGPSTGMATKVEQSDIMASVYNAHGDYSHIVLASASIEDSFYGIQEAFNLAERFQCPVLFLTDLQQGLNKQTVPIFDMSRIGIDRGELLEEKDLPILKKNEYFKRFALTESGISPRTVPGMKNGLFLSTGLEHDEVGKPAEGPCVHIDQTEKRFYKLEGVADYVKPFYTDAAIEECDVLVVSITSVNGAVDEAVADLRAEGKNVNALQLRLIAPFPIEKLIPYYEKAKKVLIIEQNATAQLASLFKMNMPNKEKIVSFIQYTGDPVVKQEAIEAIKEVL